MDLILIIGAGIVAPAALLLSIVLAMRPPKRYHYSLTATIGNESIDHVADCLSLLTDEEFKAMSRLEVIRLIETMKFED